MALLPKAIYGTSFMGNLFVETPQKTKLEVIKRVLGCGVTVFDTAGKYGAGLALEELGRCFKELEVEQESITIINKLGWKRAPLLTSEPTFEPGAWVK